MSSSSSLWREGGYFAPTNVSGFQGNALETNRAITAWSVIPRCTSAEFLATPRSGESEWSLANSMCWFESPASLFKLPWVVELPTCSCLWFGLECKDNARSIICLSWSPIETSWPKTWASSFFDLAPLWAHSSPTLILVHLSNARSPT